jgi:hypothetical protein
VLHWGNLRAGMPLRAKFYIALILTSGMIGLVGQLLHFGPSHDYYFWVLLLVTVLTSGLKVPLPTVTVTLSVNFLFILVQDLSGPAGKGQVHVEEIAGLHLRTIEALALAIEAKDATTHDHLQRVRVYATEIGKEIGMSPERTGCPAGGGAAARHRQTGGARAHHLQAGPADARRVRKDEDPSAGGRGDSGRGQIPLSGGSDRAGAPRKVGWHGLSVRPGGRGDSHRGAHSVGGRLPRCAGFGPPVPPRPAARSRPWKIVVASRARASIR